MTTLPLEGIRIVDLSHHIAGPYCTKLFADLGADVVKIEKPDGGDGARWLRRFDDDRPDPEENPLFLYLNTNRRSVVLDLKAPEGIANLKRLARDADILIESFRPGVMARLGIDYPCLERLNPGLVMTSLSNFGQAGPYRDWLATELTLNALSGMMLMTGTCDREPVKVGLSQVQYSAGAAAAIVTLAAHRYQRFTGHGQHVDVSLLEPFLNMIHQQLSRYAYMGSVQRRAPTESFPWLFQTSNGWVHASVLQVKALVEFLRSSVPGIYDAKFTDPEHWHEHVRELGDLLKPWFLERSKLQATEEIQMQGIIAAPANTEADLLDCPQLRARDFFVEADHPVAGRATYPGRYFVSDQIAKAPLRAAPLFGQHTEEVLGELDIPRPLKAAGAGEKTEGAAPDACPMPLSGVRILSVEHWAALPYGTKYLASLGAEVIVVESPARPHGSPENRATEESGGLYIEGGRNKLGITIDLAKPEGVDLFRQLVAVSDVVVDNFTPRVMSNLGLDYESLRQVKSDIITLSISGFGRKGPWRLYRGYTATAEAASGLANVTGYPDGPPVRPGGTPLGDMVSSLHTAWTLLVALEHRRRTGNGAEIDMSMIEPDTCQIGEAIVGYSLTGASEVRIGNRSPNAHPSGCYPCQGEDNWVTIAAATEGQWQALIGLLGRPSCTGEERFATREARLAHSDELDERIAEWTRTRDKTAVMEACQEAGVPAGAVLHVREILTNEHLLQRDSFEVVELPPPPSGVGHRLHLGPPWKLSKTPASSRRPPPIELGEHNTYVFGGLLGLSDSQLAALEASGVISRNLTAPLAASLDRLPRRFDDREAGYLETLGLQ